MKKALERLDSLIVKRIDPKHIEKTHYTDEQLLYFIVTAAEDCENIRVHLQLNARKIKERPALERFYRHYQNLLVFLLDKLFGYKKSQSNPTLNKLYDNISEGLAQLLNYFSNLFSEYFNLDGKMPDRAQHMEKERLQADWMKLQHLMGRQGVSEELQKAATEPIALFMTGTHNQVVTHRWFGYMEFLLAELTEWANGQHEDAEWELISLILYANLNSRKCRAYCINYIVGFTDNILDDQKKLRRLEWLLKRTRLIQARPDTAFDRKQTSLQEHIEQWIKTEIGFVKNGLPTTAEEQLVKEPNNEDPDTEEKLLTGLSVDELGAWSKAERRAGKILNKTDAEVMRLVKKMYRTPRARNPSAGSMARKTGELSVSAIRRMREMLKDMDDYFKDLENG